MKSNFKPFDTLNDKFISYLQFRYDLKKENEINLINLKVDANKIELPF